MNFFLCETEPFVGRLMLRAVAGGLNGGDPHVFEGFATEADAAAIGSTMERIVEDIKARAAAVNIPDTDMIIVAAPTENAAPVAESAMPDEPPSDDAATVTG